MQKFHSLPVNAHRYHAVPKLRQAYAGDEANVSGATNYQLQRYPLDYQVPFGQDVSSGVGNKPESTHTPYLSEGFGFNRAVQKYGLRMTYVNSFKVSPFHGIPHGFRR